jgi:hypothetical protein
MSLVLLGPLDLSCKRQKDKEEFQRNQHESIGRSWGQKILAHPACSNANAGEPAMINSSLPGEKGDEKARLCLERDDQVEVQDTKTGSLALVVDHP